MARILGVSATRIVELTKDGKLPKANGRYVLGEAIQGLLASVREDRRMNTKDSHQTKFHLARTRLTELKALQLAGDLAPREEVLQYVRMREAALMAALDGVPAAFTRDLDERERLREYLDAARRSAAAGLDESGGPDPEGDVDAEEEDDA